MQRARELTNKLQPVETGEPELFDSINDSISFTSVSFSNDPIFSIKVSLFFSGMASFAVSLNFFEISSKLKGFAGFPFGVTRNPLHSLFLLAELDRDHSLLYR
jgi:hypothetical protein